MKKPLHPRKFLSTLRVWRNCAPSSHIYGRLERTLFSVLQKYLRITFTPHENLTIFSYKIGHTPPMTKEASAPHNFPSYVPLFPTTPLSSSLKSQQTQNTQKTVPKNTTEAHKKLCRNQAKHWSIVTPKLQEKNPKTVIKGSANPLWTPPETGPKYPEKQPKSLTANHSLKVTKTVPKGCQKRTPTLN